MNFDEIKDKIKNKEPISFEEGETWIREGVPSKRYIEAERLVHSQSISEDGLAGMISAIRNLSKVPVLALAGGAWDLGKQDEKNLRRAFLMMKIKKKKLFFSKKSFADEGFKLLLSQARQYVFFTSHPENAGFLARSLKRLGDRGYVFYSSLLKEPDNPSSVSYLTMVEDGDIHSSRIDPALFALPPWNAERTIRDRSVILWMTGLMTAAVYNLSLLQGIDRIRSVLKDDFTK